MQRRALTRGVLPRATGPVHHRVCSCVTQPSLPATMNCLAHTCHNLRVAPSPQSNVTHIKMCAQKARGGEPRSLHTKDRATVARRAQRYGPHPTPAQHATRARPDVRAQSVFVCVSQPGQSTPSQRTPRWETGGAGQQRARGAVYRCPATHLARRWGPPHRPHVETRQGRHAAPPPTSGHAGE
jgi:hypothetical protein